MIFMLKWHIFISTFIFACQVDRLYLLIRNITKYTQSLKTLFYYTRLIIYVRLNKNIYMRLILAVIHFQIFFQSQKTDRRVLKLLYVRKYWICQNYFLHEFMSMGKNVGETKCLSYAHTSYKTRISVFFNSSHYDASKFCLSYPYMYESIRYAKNIFKE